MSTPSSNILVHFEKYVFGSQEIDETRANLAVRRLAQGVSVVVGIGGRLPFAAATLQYAGGGPLGWAMVVSNVVSFSCFCTDCLLHITADEVRPLSEEEKMMGKERSRVAEGVKKASLAAIGVLSQFPLAYLCYSTNGDNLAVGAIVLFDAGLPIYSLNLSAKAYEERRSAGDLSMREVLGAKYAFMGALQNYRSHLSELYSNKDVLLERLPKEAGQLIDQILERVPEQEELSSGAKVIGTLFSAAQLTLYAALTHSGMKRLTNDEASAVSASVGVTACNAYLQGDVLIRSVQDRWNAAKSLFQRGTRKTLASACFPVLSRIFSVANIALSALSFAPSAQVAKEYFSGPFGKGEEIISSMATSLLVTNSLQQVFDNFTLWLGKNTRLGDDKMRSLIALDERLQRFAIALRDAPLGEFREFVNDLTQEQRNKLLGVENTSPTYQTA